MHKTMLTTEQKNQYDVCTLAEPSTIAALIPTHNDEHAIQNALRMVLQYCSIAIVVDLGSTDRTIEIARHSGAYIIQDSRVQEKAILLTRALHLAHTLHAERVVTIYPSHLHPSWPIQMPFA
jgi:glycosyltransferase involved in cell wall biosynthesis